MIGSKVWLAGMCVAGVALVAGCGSFDRTPPPGNTAGTIYVSSPRIFGRERLINDRREHEEWLQKQLRWADEQDFGFNALVDTRTLAITAARVQGRLDPAFDVYRAQQASAASIVREQNASALAAEQLRAAAIDRIRTKLDKGEIDAETAQKQLAALGINFAAYPAALGPATPPSTAASGVPNLVADLKADNIKSPAPSSAATANVSHSPADVFRDRLALREEIRNEIQENSLDDAHDIGQHTMYRFTFDATLLPEDDTSAWAVVDVSFESPVTQHDLWDDYRAYLEDRFQKALSERASRLALAMDHADCRNVPKRLDCAVGKAFGDRFLRDTSAFVPLRAESPPPAQTPRLVPFSSLFQIAPSSARRFEAIPLDARPAKADAASVMSGDQRAIYDLLARSLVADFKAERLDCYFQLESAGEDPHYPPTSPRSIRDFSVKVGAAPVANLPDRCRTGEADSLKHAFARDVDSRAAPRVYAVTPKETVQRLSDVSSRRAATEFIAGLSTVAGAGGADAMLQMVRQNEAFLHAIRRQPLVVGFTEQGSWLSPQGLGHNSTREQVKFGWVLGPQFSIVKKGEKPAFRQTVRQQALTATLVVPSWWRTVDLRVTGRWQRENSKLQAFGNAAFEKVYRVSLPRRLAGLDGALLEVDERVPYVEQRYATEVQVGQRAQLVIRGDYLWRSTEVLLGSQAADRVRLLPDMRGVVAEFDAVRPTFGANLSLEGRDTTDIRIGTSSGYITVGTARVVSPADFRPRTAVGMGRRVAWNEAIKFNFQPALRSFRSAEVRVRSRANSVLDDKVADLASGIDIARGGSSMRLKPNQTNAKKGDLIDLHLILTSEDAVPEIVVLGQDVVYYPTANDQKGAVTWKADMAGLPTASVAFPPGARHAFASFKQGQADVVATLTAAGSTFEVARATCDVTATKPACLLKPKLPQANMSPDAAKAIKEKEFTLDVKVQGDDVPELEGASHKAKAS